MLLEILAAIFPPASIPFYLGGAAVVSATLDSLYGRG
jgi:hypothetical protein